jgi:hypothetical protein
LVDAVDSPKTKDAWDKIDIIGKLLGSILIPVGLAAAGFFVNSAFQERASKQKTEEIVITVLQSKDTTTPALRDWATGVFNEMLVSANQPLSPAATKELEKGPLPSVARVAAPSHICVPAGPPPSRGLTYSLNEQTGQYSSPTSWRTYGLRSLPGNLMGDKIS